MVRVALLVRLDAKPGKEAEVEAFLKSGLAIVNEEPATIAWFAISDGPLDLRDLRRVPRREGPSDSPYRSGRSGAHGQGRRVAVEAAHDREG